MSGRVALLAGTGTAWRSGDPAVVRALAAVELGRLGLRLPGPDGAGATARGITGARTG